MSVSTVHVLYLSILDIIPPKHVPKLAYCMRKKEELLFSFFHASEAQILQGFIVSVLFVLFGWFF